MLLLGVVVGLFNIIPVTSQSLVLNVIEAPEPVDIDDPWASVWDAADAQAVPLSAQQVIFPLGGGTVQTLVARALHDGERLYISIEWVDSEIDEGVIGAEDFADAVAVQFPADPSQNPSFTMGQASNPVNIWQWKASWQADIDRGFAGTADLYPNTYVDVYPGAGDTLNRPAEQVGNPVAQRTHESPIEALIAEGFGTLTTSDIQNVQGSGEWRDGIWRVVFARDLAAERDDLVEFTLGDTTRMAFAVWEGGADERNGLKSIASWIDLSVGGETSPGDGSSSEFIGGADKGNEVIFWFLGLFVVTALVAVGVTVGVLRKSRA